MIDNWDQYKDLEYYPDRVCKCGCGGRIKVRSYHKYRDELPEYLPGHNGMSEEGKQRLGKHVNERQKGIPPWNKGLTKKTDPRVGKLGFKPGHAPWNKDKKGLQTAWNKDLTKETDERVLKMANSKVGHAVSPETVEKIRKANTKILNEIRVCACGECGETFECKVNSTRKFVNRDHYMRWMKNNHIDRFDHSNPVWNSGLTKETDERVKKTGEAVGKALKGYKRSDEFCRKNRENMLEAWSDPEFAKMMIEAQHRKPNKPEKRLNKFLQEILSREYQINVNAEVMTLGRKCPDFVNVNGQKKIIEMNGDWWHGEKKTGRTKEEEEHQRIDCFAQFGWKTLIIWEHELENLERLKSKILEFNNETKDNRE